MLLMDGGVLSLDLPPPPTRLLLREAKGEMEWFVGVTSAGV